MCDGVLHYQTVRPGQLEAKIVEALQLRFEEADDADLLGGYLKADVLIEQVKLDVSTLLREWNVASPQLGSR